MIDVSVVIVNYFLSDIISQKIDGLLKEDINSEIIIVDNSVDEKEENSLNKLSKNKKIKTIINKQNIGFASACNQGVAISSGKYVFFLNPDAYIIEGSLEILFKFAKELNADAIGPKIFLDDDMTIPQPPFLPPTPLHVIFHNLFPKFYSKFWKKYSYKFWNINKPVKMSFLSGAGFLIKKEIARFDERYFMYFEDTDLFLSLKKTHKKIYFCPYAKIIHMFDLSPSNKKTFFFEKSKRLFYKKNYPHLKRIINLSEKYRKYYRDKNRIPLKDFNSKLKQNIPVEISINLDFVPFVRTRLNFKNTPSFIERYRDYLWIRIAE